MSSEKNPRELIGINDPQHPLHRRLYAPQESEGAWEDPGVPPGMGRKLHEAMIEPAPPSPDPGDVVERLEKKVARYAERQSERDEFFSIADEETLRAMRGALALIQSQREEIERLTDHVATEDQIIRRMCSESDVLQAAMIAPIKDRDSLREFFEKMASGVWDIGMEDMDGGDFQDTAEKLGLIVKVPADEAFKAEYDCDEMYVWAWNPIATRHLGEEK